MSRSHTIAITPPRFSAAVLVIVALLAAMTLLPVRAAHADATTGHMSSYAGSKAADGAGVTTVSQMLGNWQVVGPDGVNRWDVTRLFMYDVKVNGSRSTISFGYRVYVQTKEAGGSWTTFWSRVRKCQSLNVVQLDPPNPPVTSGDMRVLVDIQPIRSGTCNHHLWNRFIHSPNVLHARVKTVRH